MNNNLFVKEKIRNCSDIQLSDCNEFLVKITKDKKIVLNEKLKSSISEDEYAKRMFSLLKKMIEDGGYNFGE